MIILILISRTILSKNNKQNKLSLEEQLKKLPYYQDINLNRYKAYQTKEKNKSLEQIIIYVNIGLDKPFYTNIKKANTNNPILTLVNKYNYLDQNYIPNNLEIINSKYSTTQLKLVNEARIAFEELASSAEKENLNIIALSTYRSYSYQKNLYNRYVQEDGILKADTYSARPGHSEHQTGLAIDIYNKKVPYTNFDQTEEFIWMQQNAHKYGFILRYPKNKEHITGYTYEPWHYRYIGIKEATYIYNNKITYEEYYTKFIENKK